MAPRLPNIFRHSGAGRDERQVNMTREEEEAIVQANIRNMLATFSVTAPAPSAPRWSRTSYSISIYTQDSRFDEDASTLRPPSPPTPEQSPPNAPHAARNTSRKKCIMHGCLWISAVVFVFLGIIAIVIVQQTRHHGGDSGPSSTPTHKPVVSTSTSTSQQHATEIHSIADSDTTSSSSTASTSTTQKDGAGLSSTTNSDPTSSASSTVAVVQVATEVVRTTVGTLTTSALTSAATSSRTSIQSSTFSAYSDRWHDRPLRNFWRRKNKDMDTFSTIQGRSKWS